MKKSNRWIALLTVILMFVSVLSPVGEAVMSAKEKAEESLKEKLNSYRKNYPEGGFAFYGKSGVTIKEGQNEKEILLVRLGNAGKEATVDLKCLDVTAKYGKDYEVYVEDGADRVKIAPQKNTKTVAEQAMQGETKQKEKNSKTEQTEKEKTSLQKNYEKQTGNEQTTANWRDEWTKYKAKQASVKAENELINSVKGPMTTIHFDAGEYKKKVYIRVLDDAIAECEETADLILGNASVGLIGTQGQKEIKIKDNEEPEKITFAMDKSEITTAKKSLKAKVTIKRTSGFGYYAAASYQTVSGTADAVDDYEPVNGGKVNFAPGEKEKTVTISLEKKAEEGTYFNVLLDGSAVNVKKDKERTKVWIGKKEEAIPVTNTKKFKKLKETYQDGVCYDTLTVVEPNDDNVRLWAHVHTRSDLWQSSYKSRNYAQYSGEAVKVTYKTKLDGYSENWFIKKIPYYDKNGTLWLAGNEKIYHSTDKQTDYYTDTRDIGFWEGVNGEVKVRAKTDGLCRKSEYSLTDATYYYPRYTVKLEDAVQNLKGKNYTSLNKSTEFNVPSLEGYAGWRIKTVRQGGIISLMPGTLTHGVQIDGYDLYVGGKKIDDSLTGDNMISYSSLNLIRAKNEALLKQNQYTVIVKPRYKLEDATVSFRSQDKSSIAYTGDKGESGFKTGETLHCKKIDKVTFTATCPTNQKVKVSSVKLEHVKTQSGREFFYTVPSDSANNRFTPSGEDEELRFTKTVNVWEPNERITVYYKEPKLTLQYEPTEVGAPNKDAGAVTIADYSAPDKVLGTSTYAEPYVLNGGIQMLRSQYLFSVFLGEKFKHFTAPDGNGNTLSFSTKTKWTYPDEENGGKPKTVMGNAFVYAPYYADSTVSYYYSAVQDDQTQVGLDGKVSISEKPLFSNGSSKTKKIDAVGVKVNIGGYQAVTGSDGAYHIDANFNKGEYVGAFLTYDTMSMVDNVALSKNTKKDFTIDADKAEKLRITSSSMKRCEVSKDRNMKNEKIINEKDTAGILLEDTKYRLILQAQGSAGVTPAKAKFKFYDKKGTLKNDLTQEITFKDDTAELTLNPMSVGGATGKSLAVGDGITVTLIDNNGTSYFEHQTGIVIGEKLDGMFAFNYKGVKREDDNAFVKAIGNISVGYDFVIDLLSCNAGMYPDEDGVHQIVCVGFGDGFGDAKDIYDKEQETIKQLEQANTVGITPKKNDSLSFAGNDSWGLDIQVGAIMDCVIEQEDEKHRGQCKFNDYVLIGSVVFDYHKEWETSVGPVGLTFILDFKTGDKQDGDATGVKWHFYNPSDKPFYVSGNDVFDMLASKEIESQGDLAVNARIEGRVDAKLLDVFNVSGALAVEFENHFAHQTDKGWTNSGAIILTPTVRLGVGFVKIPVWTQDWRYDYNNENVNKNMLQSAVNEAYDNADILMTKTDQKEVNDYSYTKKKQWKGTQSINRKLKNKKTVKQFTKQVLLEGFYDESKMRMQDLGNGKYLMVFLDDDRSRAAEDGIGAYYTIYNGSSWSVPKLLEDDGTADELPVICDAGSKGYLIVWSDASGAMDADKNMSDNLNLYDLTGCFYDKESGTMGEPMAITKTTAQDNAADTNPKVAYDKDDEGNESLRIYYNKSEYSVSNEADGEVVGDLLNPYQVIAVRNYDFTNNSWSEEFPDDIKNSMDDAAYEEYKENWYGQEFLDLAPSISVKEELDEDGYWKEGTTAGITELTDKTGIAKEGDVISYNHLNLHAYALDKGGNAQQTKDENLYLQIYNAKEKAYHHPIQITSKDADISDIQFMRSTVPDGDGGKAEVTFLYWLEDGVVKRINVGSVVNSLKKETTAQNKTYYYIDKTKGGDSQSSAYLPEEIIAKAQSEKREGDTEENDVLIQDSITSYRVKHQGDYTYLVWNQLTPAEEEKEQKIESQLYAVRINEMTGDASLAVKLTDEKDLYIKNFDCIVTEDGNLDVMTGQTTLNADGEPDTSQSKLAFYQVVPSQNVTISDVTKEDVAVTEDNKKSISLSAKIGNDSLQTEKELTVCVQDKDGNVISENNNEPAKMTLQGGETQEVNVIVPLNADGSYEGNLVVKQDNTVLVKTELNGKAEAVLSGGELQSEITKRNHVSLTSRVTNDSLLDSKPYQVTFGYEKKDGSKVKLKTIDMPALKSFDSADVSYEAEVDFDKFNSETKEDGSQTDSLNFYMDVNTKDFVPVYHTVELTADAKQMSLMKSLKNVSAKCAATNQKAEVEEVTNFQKGDTAKLELTVDNKFAQNTAEYVNGLKVVWEETENNVVKVSRNGSVTALGKGTAEVSGYIVPADTETLLLSGCAVAVDNYQTMPSAAIVPVHAKVVVNEKQNIVATPTPKPTTQPTAKPTVTPTKKKMLKVGTTFKDKKSMCKYKVIKGKKGKRELSLEKYYGKNGKSVTIPKEIKKNGYRYPVTKIAAKAFYKRKKIQKITIKSLKIRAVGRKAIYGIYKKAVILVPKKKYKAYKKLLRAKTGFKKTMKIKKR